MNLSPFKGPGSTRIRREFWGDARAAVIASQKLAGQNTSISEFPGKGTIINAARMRTTPTGATGACCIDGACSILSVADCAAASGYYAGDGTDCGSDPCSGIGCCSYFLDGVSYCITVTPEICATHPGSTFTDILTFCAHEGAETGITNSCCNVAVNEHRCVSNDASFYFCCGPDQICCNEECCNPGETCNGVFCEAGGSPLEDPFFANN